MAFEATSNNCARIYRHDITFDGSVMITGDYFQHKMTLEGIEEFVAADPEKHELLNDFRSIYNKITSSVEKGRFMGVREDHGFYSKNRDKYSASKTGKLLLVDKLDPNVHHIFFDDNINKDEDCCVDVWDLSTKERIPIEESYDTFLHEVDTLAALSDPDYFINAFNRCVSKREEHLRVHSGVEPFKHEEQKNLQTCSPNEYIERTVLPLLKPALKILDKEQPEDPLSFLAVYLVENKDKIANDTNQKPMRTIN